MPDITRVQAIDGADLLEEIQAVFKKYCVLPNEAAYTAVTLWTAYTHCISAFDYAPRLVLRSSVKRSGKTRVLEVIHGLAHRPIRTSSVSVAYLFRVIGKEDPPTMLIDEADAIFGTRIKADQNEDLRGLLNAGFQRGSTVGRVNGRQHEPKEYETFAPVALAGIGRLPDTIEDRAVVIQMRRRKPSEMVSTFRIKRDGPILAELCSRLELWAGEVREVLQDAEPELPVDDRAADTWEPLVALADAAGGPWGRDARAAAVQFTDEAVADDGQSLPLMLLSDTRQVFTDLNIQFIGTMDLIGILSGSDDSVWSDLTAAGLGRKLRSFGVSTSHSADKKSRGYWRNDFKDAFDRYLPA